MTTPAIIFVNKVRDINPQRRLDNIGRKLLKIGEELGEAMEAYLNVTSPTNGKGKTWDDVREEVVDAAIVIADVGLTLEKSLHVKGEDEPFASYDISSAPCDERWLGRIYGTMGDLNTTYFMCDGEPDLWRLACTAENMFEQVFGILLGLPDETPDGSKLLAELDRKLAKWMANMDKMPTNDVQDDT